MRQVFAYSEYERCLIDRTLLTIPQQKLLEGPAGRPDNATKIQAAFLLPQRVILDEAKRKDVRDLGECSTDLEISPTLSGSPGDRIYCRSQNA
jgi:hypothetical protein